MEVYYAAMENEYIYPTQDRTWQSQKSTPGCRLAPELCNAIMAHTRGQIMAE